MRPDLIFPDVEYLLIQLLSPRFPAWDVTTIIPSDESLRGNRVISIQRFGGSDVGDVREDPGVGVNIYAPTWTEAAEAAISVRAHMTSRGFREGTPLLLVRTTVAPQPIQGSAEEKVPQYYLAFTVFVRGKTFNPSSTI